MVCKYSSISDTPRFERLTVVRIFLSTISLVMITSPACSRFVSSTDRFPLLSPVTRCRKTKQFQGLLSVHSCYNLQTHQVALCDPSTPEARAALLPPPPLRLLPGGAIQFPGGSFTPLWTSAFSRRTVIACVYDNRENNPRIFFRQHTCSLDTMGCCTSVILPVYECSDTGSQDRITEKSPWTEISKR
jgi:hypothetical protein